MTRTREKWRSERGLTAQLNRCNSKGPWHAGIMGKSRREQFTDHLGRLSDEDRERTLHTIVGQVYLAVEGVDLQARRLRASHSVVHTEHQSDAIFFIVALQRLMVLLDLALELAPEDRRAELSNAIERLRSSAGDTEGARDVLAHLDEYLTRFGKKQAEARDLPFAMV
jgi:hypothetical protein